MGSIKNHIPKNMVTGWKSHVKICHSNETSFRNSLSTRVSWIPMQVGNFFHPIEQLVCTKGNIVRVRKLEHIQYPNLIKNLKKWIFSGKTTAYQAFQLRYSLKEKNVLATA